MVPKYWAELNFQSYALKTTLSASQSCTSTFLVILADRSCMVWVSQHCAGELICRLDCSKGALSLLSAILKLDVAFYQVNSELNGFCVSCEMSLKVLSGGVIIGQFGS